MESLTPVQQELYDWLVQYIETTHHAPSIRQMMRAMNLRSSAPVQSRLEYLRKKGYLEWTEGQARTIRILHHKSKGMAILGEILAGGLVETYTDEKEKLDLSQMFQQTDCYALRVVGDGMIEDQIRAGDMVILRPLMAGDVLPNGEIVVAKVEGYGTMLKRFYQAEDRVLLKPTNANSEPIEVMDYRVEIKGILVGIWRSYL
ncbi:MAG: transcriptional repressor LexA [Snowella sp.]|nr:transcriptional repressor LexA [Snowella sp.]